MELPEYAERPTAAMGEGATVNTSELTTLYEIAEEVARALSFATAQGGSAFVSTAVRYPNGSAVVVRIDQDDDGFFVTDDGQGSFIADTMGGGASYGSIASAEAKRAGVSFDQHSIFTVHVPRDRLPGATALIANVSNRAVERTAFALDAQKQRRSQEQFRLRLRSAFGERVAFDIKDVRGAWRSWSFDAAVQDGRYTTALFSFVSPSMNAVAHASLKLRDIRSLEERPRLVVALSDYQKTEDSLRALLNQEADKILAAESERDVYVRAAA